MISYPKNQSFLEKLTGIVLENLSSPDFGVKELTQIAGISHSGLHRKLKSITGQSISLFIRDIRLKKSMELLKNQAGNVAEIAYGVGFGSTSYFSRCFHEYYGFPPVEISRRYHASSSIPINSTEWQNRVSAIRSIAVLPFENYTGDSSLDFLANGLHEELINRLGQIQTIRVLSRASMLMIEPQDVLNHGFAPDEGIDFILAGSFQSSSDQIRMHLRLFRAHLSEEVLWEDSYELSLNKVLGIFSSLTNSLMKTLDLSLGKDQRKMLDGQREVNSNSFRAYLRGRYQLYQLTEEGIRSGLEYLLESVRIDPAEPFAYAGLALGYMEIAHGPLNEGDAYEKAEWAANMALKLGPELAETQLALAEICMYSTWQFEESERRFKLALELNPSLSLAHYHYSWLLFLLKRDEEAVKEHQLAQRYDPFNPMIIAFTGLIYAYTGRYEEAIREAHKCFQIQKDCPDAYFVLEETYMLMGRKREALEASRKLAGSDPVWQWVHGYVCALCDHRDEAQEVLDVLLEGTITSWTAMGIAVIEGAMGNFDTAFRWIGYKPHHAWIPWIAVMPMWNPLKVDMRFNTFVRALNLGTDI